MTHFDDIDPKADETRDSDLRDSAREQPDEVRARRDPDAVKGAENDRDADRGGERGAGRGATPETIPAMSEDPHTEPQTELELLRSELAALQERVSENDREVELQRSRALRARAELDTVRRRAAGDEDRARDAGLDAALLPVMGVFDDLRRALAASESGDPAAIVPGVRAVMEGLERELGRLDIERVGEVGEPFDHDLHEALTTVPAPGREQSGTIAEVFEAGFRRGERLIRPARVVVYQDGQG